MVSEEQRPLARLRNIGGLLDDVDDRIAILHVYRHEEARHDRKVERHVALVARAEILDGVLRPLVGLCEEHPVVVVSIDVRAKFSQKRVGLREVLAVRAVPLVEIGDRVESEAVDAEPEPEVESLDDGFADVGALEVQVGLVRKEAVPVVRLRDRVPAPVRRFEVGEDDARVGVALGRLAPHVEVPMPTAWRRPSCALEPRVLVGGVVDDELGDDSEAAAVGLAQERFEVVESAVVRMDLREIGDVVSVVAER